MSAKDNRDWMGHLADLHRLQRKQASTIEVNQRTEITERRAPTDESVRLLSEMERAAENRLVSVMRCESNKLKFTAHVFEIMGGFENRMRVRCALNDEVMDFDVNLDDARFDSQEAMILKCRDEIAKQIANRILIADADTLFRKFR